MIFVYYEFFIYLFFLTDGEKNKIDGEKAASRVLRVFAYDNNRIGPPGRNRPDSSTSIVPYYIFDSSLLSIYNYNITLLLFIYFFTYEYTIKIYYNVLT